MSLMSGSTSLEKLQRKYSGFAVPSLEIAVDGASLAVGRELHVQQMSVDLTCGFEASGCEFLAGSCYSLQDRDFSRAMEKFQVGSKIEISLGYQATEPVFQGYINEVGYEFGNEEAPMIRVKCMDAKGLLMKNRRLEAFKEKQADAVVRKLLSEQPVSSYLSGKTVDSCSSEEVPLRTGMKTDYDIIVELARKTGYEFFIIQGKAYFRQGEKSTSPIMTLTPRCRVEECISTVSGNSLIQTVEVRSIHAGNGKLISGKASISGSFGSKASRLYQGTAQVFYEAGVESAKEASDRAKARMEALRAQFCSLELTCMGIPELVPGRFVSLDQFADAVNGKYYITAVTHRCSASEFSTTIKGQRKSL